MCDGVVPTDSSWSMSGYQESVGVHVDVHSQHVGFDLVSWCGPFRYTVLHHHEGTIILPQWPNAPSVVAFLPAGRPCLTLRSWRASLSIHVPHDRCVTALASIAAQ